MRTILWRLWLILRDRPFATCPLCGGTGDECDNWGEWMECECCDHWKHLEDWGMPWFVGRVPLLRWPAFWLLAHTGLHRSWIGWALCSLGFHDWRDESFGRLCRRCYEMREQQEPTESPE